MLLYSSKKQLELQPMFEKKFEELAQKLAIDQELSFSRVAQAIESKNRSKVEDENGGEDMQLLFLKQVKLGIDFTRLAKLAHQQPDKSALSNFFINMETEPQKKIPYYIVIEEFEKAWEEASNSGDPNNINKVIKELFKTKSEDEALSVIASRRDGLRYLRNYAKSRTRQFALTSGAEIGASQT